MLQFAANLSLLYPDLPFLARFEAAAADGFKGVEYLFPYGQSPTELSARLRDLGLQQVLFNAPAAGLDTAGFAAAWGQGERGTAALPGREAEFRAGLQAALAWAEALGCPRVHTLLGVRPASVSAEQADATAIANLRWAAPLAAQAGVTLLIEALNPHSVPGYCVQRQAHAHALVQAIDHPAVQVQMDLFHCQRTEGDLTHQIRTWLPTGRVGHVQLADAPDRHEPGTGEIHWPHVLAELDAVAQACAWHGWVGCEYHPADPSPGGTSRGLGWLTPWR